MNFKNQYTTSELIAKDDKEKSKIVLSNDAYAIGQLLETLCNKLVK